MFITMANKRQSNRKRIPLAQRRKKTLRKQLKHQLKLVKKAYLPLPRSIKDTKSYLVNITNFIFSRDGIIIELEAISMILIVLFIIVIGIFALFNQDLNNLEIFAPNSPGSVTYYDRTGKIILWQDYNSVKRIPISGKVISNYVKEATVAVEDKNFYHDGGFDPASIIRAAFHDIIHHGQELEGASTITEQLVKLNKGWSDPLTIPQKLEELGLSVELSHEYTKNQILTAYLNIAPYGNIDYGVEAAARDYFHENASQLTLAQSAMLAAIPQAPTYYSPFNDPKYNPAATVDYFNASSLIARQQYILGLMTAQHMITKKQETLAKKINILSQVHQLNSKYHNIIDPYFVMATKEQLLTKYGSKMLKHGAWKVTTTLSIPLQQLANKLVQKNISNIKVYGADEEALVAEQAKTGQVVALVGGTNFNQSKYGHTNYAQTNISPGPSIEPFVYSTFINNPKNDAGAGSVLYDIQQALPGYPCTNKSLPNNGGNCLWDSNYSYPGPETIRYALGGSRNVPAVKAGLMSNLTSVEKTTDAMMGSPNGYKCFKPDTSTETASLKQAVSCPSSAAIGQGGYLHLNQEVNGLATLSNLGQEVPQTYILSIKNSADQSIYNWQQPTFKQVIQPDTAYIIDNILSDPNASNLPGYCNSLNCTPISDFGYKWQHSNGWDIAIKTGTTQNDTSGLMTAWSTEYAVAVWVGYHSLNKPLTTRGTEYITEPLARSWLTTALGLLHTKPVNWVKPSNIKTNAAFVIHNKVSLGSIEPSPSKDIYPYWYVPKANQDKAVTIDKVSGLLATACTPADAKETIYNDSAEAFSVDKFVSGASSIPNSSDNIHKCGDHGPSIVITQPPGDDCSNDDNNGLGCQISATITQGTYPLSSSKFPGSVNFTINSHTIKDIPLNSTSPQTVSFYYLPTTTTLITITGTVTDSVLYQGSSSVSFQATYTPPSSISTSAPNNTNQPPATSNISTNSLPIVGGN